MFYAGDYAGACKTAQGLNPQPKALLAACIAAQQGAKAGMDRVNGMRSDDDSFKHTAHTAGEMLMNVRQYPLAAEFLQAGAAGDNAGQSVGPGVAAERRAFARGAEVWRHAADLVKRYFLMSMDPEPDAGES